MLEVIDLTVAYGPVVALHGVSLTVPDGSMTAVLGANGAGKTTLVRTISGLTRSRGGSVRLDGRDITRLAPEEIARLGVAHVPQGQGVLAELTVDENLRLGGLWRRDPKGQRGALAEAYDLFPPLANRRHVAAFSLSGGERQMLSLGRALVARARVLLLDEPSLGLARLVLVQIMARLRTLVTERGLTVLLIEQNAKSALSVADEGIVLHLGKVVARGRAQQLLSEERLRHAYLGF
jgi:branched-chain amino acid transport system ATP-binding protein